MPTTFWTPLKLIRRILSLLRERPALVLPVLLADLLAFAVMHLQKLLQKPLLELVFTSRQSVLSAKTAFAISPAQTHNATLLITALVWVAYFFSGLFYTVALVATFTLVERRPVRPDLLAKKFSLLRFALFFWALIIAGWLISSPILSMVTQKWAATKTNGFGMAYFAGLILESVIAICALGPALRLLNPAARLSTLAALAAAATLVAQGCIDFGLRQLPLNTFFSQQNVTAILCAQLVVSLVAALPYVLLFVALSLLAERFSTADVVEG